MSEGRDLPFLKDVSVDGPQTHWSPQYRDVVVVNARGQQVAAFNLTSNSLGLSANYNQLKSLVQIAATFEDADADGLGDDWEDLVLGGDSDNSADPDKDGAAHSIEYALGSDGTDGGSLPGVSPGIQTVIEGDRYLTVTFRQRLGATGGLQYFVEVADGAGGWNSYPVEDVQIRRTNIYDGTGTLEVTCRVPDPIPSDGESQSLVRVRAQRP